MKKSTLVILYSLACLALFVASGCGDDDGDILIPVGTNVGDLAADFTLLDQQGRPVSLYMYEGHTILLNFVAMWCPHCQAEATRLEGLYQKYISRGLQIITVIIQDEEKNPCPCSSSILKEWADAYGLTFPVLSDVDQDLFMSYELQGIPQNVLIDQQMVIRAIIAGYDEDEIESWIQLLVGI